MIQNLKKLTLEAALFAGAFRHQIIQDPEVKTQNRGSSGHGTGLPMLLDIPSTLVLCLTKGLCVLVPMGRDRFALSLPILVP